MLNRKIYHCGNSILILQIVTGTFLSIFKFNKNVSVVYVYVITYAKFDVLNRHLLFSFILLLVVLYKKIVNHPYLIHCPRDSVGLPRIDNDLIRDSGKLLVLDAMLAKLNAQGHKVLLFSTMTKILDVLEDYLMLRDYKYVRLDGLTKIEQRKEDIQAFNNKPEIFLFLVSARAGGVGLNLASADTVIIYDSNWVS